MIKSFTLENKRNFFLLLLATVFHFGSLSFMFLLPKYLKHIGGNETQIGFVIGIIVFPALLIPLAAGYLSQRVAAKKLMLLGIAVMIGSTLAYLKAEQINGWVYLIRFIHGSGHLLFFTVLFAAIAQIVPSKNRAQGLSYLAICFQVANSLGSVLADKIIDSYGFNNFFIISALIGLSAAAIMFFFKEPKQKNKQAQSLQKENNSYFQLVFQRKIFSGLILVLILGGATGTTLMFFPVFLDALFQNGQIARPVPASNFLFIAFMTIGITRIMLSKLTDKHGPKKIIYFIMPLLLVSLLLTFWIKGPVLVIFIAVIFGFSVGFLYPAANALIQNRVKASQRFKISSVLVMLYDIGFSGFSLFLGSVIFYSGYYVMFFILAGLLALGLLQFYLVEKSRKGLSRYKKIAVNRLG